MLTRKRNIRSRGILFVTLFGRKREKGFVSKKAAAASRDKESLLFFLSRLRGEKETAILLLHSRKLKYHANLIPRLPCVEAFLFRKKKSRVFL